MALPTGLTQVSLPTTPLQQAYSQTLDFNSMPDDWLPAALGQGSHFIADAAEIGSVRRDSGQTVSEMLVANKSTETTAWVGGLGQWTASEDVMGRVCRILCKRTIHRRREPACPQTQ